MPTSEDHPSDWRRELTGRPSNPSVEELVPDIEAHPDFARTGMSSREIYTIHLLQRMAEYQEEQRLKQTGKRPHPKARGARALGIGELVTLIARERPKVEALRRLARTAQREHLGLGAKTPESLGSSAANAQVVWRQLIWPAPTQDEANAIEEGIAEVLAAPEILNDFLWDRPLSAWCMWIASLALEMNELEMREAWRSMREIPMSIEHIDFHSLDHSSGWKYTGAVKVPLTELSKDDLPRVSARERRYLRTIVRELFEIARFWRDNQAPAQGAGLLMMMARLDVDDGVRELIEEAVPWLEEIPRLPDIKAVHRRIQRVDVNRLRRTVSRATPEWRFMLELISPRRSRTHPGDGDEDVLAVPADMMIADLQRMIGLSTIFGPPPRPHRSPKREAATRRWTRVDQFGRGTVAWLAELHPVLRRLPQADSVDDIARATGMSPQEVERHHEELDQLLAIVNPRWRERLDRLFATGR
jgi:hypothetical protein